MEVGDVPASWASGDAISREDRLMIALLRVGGCTCELPLIRHARDETGMIVNDGPRCKVCNTQVFLAEPTEEQRKARDRHQHLGQKRMIEKHPELLENEFLAGLGDCYEGCGCENG